MNKYALLGFTLCFAVSAQAAPVTSGGLLGKWRCQVSGVDRSGNSLLTGSVDVDTRADGTTTGVSVLTLPLRGQDFRYKSQVTEKWWLEGDIQYTTLTGFNIQRAHGAKLNRMLQIDESLREFENNLYQKSFIDSNKRAVREKWVRENRILELTDTKMKTELKELGSVITTVCNKAATPGGKRQPKEPGTQKVKPKLY